MVSATSKARNAALVVMGAASAGLVAATALAVPAGEPSASDNARSAPFSAVVGVDPEQLTCAPGGAVGGEFVRTEDLMSRMRDGQSYRLFDLTGEIGEVISIGGPRFEGGDGECVDLWRQELSLDPRKRGGFSVGLHLPDGAKNPLPEPLKVLDAPLPEHVKALREFLARRDVPNPEPEFAQVIRTDLDGDGAIEYILNVVRIGEEHARKGDHSIVLVMRGQGEATRTFIIQEEIDLEDSEFPSTLWVNTIAAVVDVDGDGVAEIITEGGYIYGGGWEVIRWDGNAFDHVLFCGCDG